MSKTYQFEVMIKQTQEGHYWAAVPLLPGCYSTGPTAQEAARKAMAAAQCYCWNMLENGAPIPQTASLSPVMVQEISVQI